MNRCDQLERLIRYTGKGAVTLGRPEEDTTCPFCRRGSLRIIAALTQEAVITRILCRLKLAAVPPPIAPARSRQETCDGVA